MTTRPSKDHLEVDALAVVCCVYEGTDNRRPYVHGKRKGQAREVYQVTEKFMALWKKVTPYVAFCVLRSVGWVDPDVVAEIRCGLIRRLHDYGPTPNGRPFHECLALAVNNHLTNRVRRLSDVYYELRDPTVEVPEEDVEVVTALQMRTIAAAMRWLSKKDRERKGSPVRVAKRRVEAVAKKYCHGVRFPSDHATLSLQGGVDLGDDESHRTVLDMVPVYDDQFDLVGLDMDVAKADRRVVTAILQARTIRLALEHLNERPHPTGEVRDAAGRRWKAVGTSKRVTQKKLREVAARYV